jgi:hypothetical protein
MRLTVVREEVRVSVPEEVRAEASGFLGFLRRLNHSQRHMMEGEFTGPPV